MFLSIILIIAGLVLILFGANFLVDGSSAIARRFGLSEFVIGLTIVGIGTSMPEMVVSFISAIRGNSDIAVGNIVGSNIFNVFLTLGITTFILPLTFTKNNRKIDVPITLIASLLLLFLGYDSIFCKDSANMLGRMDGAILLLCFVVFMVISFKTSESSEQDIEAKQVKLKHAIIYVIIGLGGLIWGGEIFVNSAGDLAKKLGVSDAFIAITLMAGGTSLPELAACIIAAIKKRGQLALGNIIGSNVSNIFLILGGSALIHPLSMEHITHIDIGVMILSSLLLFFSATIFRLKKLTRIEGVIYVLVYAGYIFWLSTNL